MNTTFDSRERAEAEAALAMIQEVLQNATSAERVAIFISSATFVSLQKLLKERAMTLSHLSFHFTDEPDAE